MEKGEKGYKVIGMILLLLAVTIVAGVVWYFTTRTEDQTIEGKITTNDHSTDLNYNLEGEVPPADPMIVGKWHNCEKPQWYKVYYDDYDENEGLYWGKEWNEAEDVTEEDLRYHGNGWFRWDKRGNTLREFATMDARDVPIAKIYTVCYLSEDSIAYYEEGRKKHIQRFRR